MRLNEGVVDSDDLNVGVLDGVAEDDTSNAAEAVDADLDNHCDLQGSVSGVSQRRRKQARLELELEERACQQAGAPIEAS